MLIASGSTDRDFADNLFPDLLEPVSFIVSESKLSFVVAHVPCETSRQVSTTLSLPHQLQVQSGGEAFEVVYFIIPYTKVPTVLPFTVDIYSDVQVDCSPVTKGLQAMYHRHPIGEYDPQWQQDISSNEFVAECFYAAEFDSEVTCMMDALSELISLLTRRELTDNEKDVASALNLMQNAASVPFDVEDFVAEVSGSYDTLTEAVEMQLLLAESKKGKTKKIVASLDADGVQRSHALKTICVHHSVCAILRWHCGFHDGTAART